MLRELMLKARASLATLAVIAGASGLAAGPAWAAPSSRFTVSGAVASPTTYDLAGLAARPALTQTVSFGSGSGTQTHTYTGTSLWGVLSAAGVTADAAIKNDINTKIVVATGSDGYRSVFSLAELNPGFGNRPDLIAYAETLAGVSAPLAADGFARTTAPGDAKGGRYVSNLADLNVRGSGSQQAGSGGGVATQFTVTGAVASSMSFDLAALQGLPVLTETVGGHLYTGVSLWGLLNSGAGIPLDPTAKNDVLSRYVVATGSDGYQTVFSLGELSPDFGNQPDLIAYAIDGTPLGDSGFARLVVPGDVKAGRWVANLVNLDVFSVAPVPEPQTAALMVAGLGALAAGVRCRRPGAAPH